MNIKLLTLWLMLFAGMGVEDHDVPVANFQFTISPEVIVLEAQFDKEDFETALKKKNPSKNNAVQYFNFNTSFFINKTESDVAICGFRTDKAHYYLDVEIDIDPGPLKELKVFSTCLVKEIKDHSTILFIEETGKELRGFRLHKGRIHTTIDF